MNIAIDAREAFALKKAGKGQWTKGFLDELQTRDITLTVLNEETFAPGLRWHFRSASFVQKSDIDAYISPTSLITPAILGRTVPSIPIIHDLIAFRSEPHSLKAKVIERMLMKHVVKTAAHICTVSETTKQDLCTQFPGLDPETVTPIYAGPMQEHPTSNTPDGKTILCAGTLCPRKNQLRLIRAYASLPEDLRQQYRLLLVGGRGWNDEEIVRLCDQVKGVTWKDYVSDEEYQDLMTSATVLAYPSLYEGFGLQVLDGLQRGVPILTSDHGSLKEVVAGCGLTVDPEDDSSIALGLERILRDADLRKNLASKGPIQAKNFTWKRTVDLFLQALEKAL